ncbi:MULTISPECIES: hypothetical protein [unclassified Mesorhizobium]|uniref:hypothetical protein n=1 Tax=unclassified Mesorhizobium TaxID=325217 RepID=UPI0016762602|nr:MULTISPECIES: hypothetical protein [unclassified Mesorhizobium]
MSWIDAGHLAGCSLADGHFAGDTREIGGLDADVGTLGAAHRMKQRQRRTISLMFLWARPGKHFREETHDSGSWLVLHTTQYT